ncbi:methylated-DNA--[protein]-cysteine S-methyltransferase [candidate division KSB1 bacterium]|nr:methylated-DNA--[protein]-cysteine S-methyltransferase [candidate division KSB1 bacterium]
MHTTFYRSEIGFLKITGSEHGIHSIEFTEETAVPETELPVCLRDCVRQLDEYFEGRRKIFDLKLKPEGTDFQKRVWQELLNIPYGKTATYLDIAKAIDNVKAIRAVGAANGQNHIPIIIPCHRVIGRDGSLIGFGGGIWRKEFLLRHEGALMV